jgi:hypothetical protein
MSRRFEWFEEGWSLKALRCVSASVLALCAGTSSAYAISGEDERTIAIFPSNCADTTADALIACFERADGTPRCDLFGVSGTLPTGLCRDRSVLLDPQFLPDEGPIEENVVFRGTSHGYIRALEEDGLSHIVTQTFGNIVENAKIARDLTSADQCNLIQLRQPPVSDQFCANVAAALPDTAPGDALRFVITYDFENGVSNFGTDEFMEVWACPGFTAQCVAGDATQLVSSPTALLNEDWLRLGLSNSFLRGLK